MRQNQVMQKFSFEIDPTFRHLLKIWGVTRSSAVYVGDGKLKVDFGWLGLETPISNVSATDITGDYKWWRAIGPRGSLADKGVTFGTNTDKGAYVEFHEPVEALKVFKHPNLTVTLSDCEGFVELLDSLTGA